MDDGFFASSVSRIFAAVFPRFGMIVDMRMVASNLTDFAGRHSRTPDAFGSTTIFANKMVRISEYNSPVKRWGRQ